MCIGRTSSERLSMRRSTSAAIDVMCLRSIISDTVRFGTVLPPRWIPALKRFVMQVSLWPAECSNKPSWLLKKTQGTIAFSVDNWDA